MSKTSETLRAIDTFEELIRYLEDELDWPLQEYGFEELTFEYSPEELGIKVQDAAKIGKIHQLRPLYSGQPWGIFFVEFESKKLPVVVLRRILSHLVIKKRASANKSQAAAWDAEDLLFISAFGENVEYSREIAFAHFHQEPGDLPSLRVLGWDGADTPLKLDHLDQVLHDRLRWPDKPAEQSAWRKQWSVPFRHRLGHVIRTADALAEVLAELARGIRDRAKTMLAAESEHGPLRALHKAFQTSLIYDLSEESFADTYAQTITYGLLTAAISRTDRSGGREATALIAENITDMVPVTNPFLKEMLQTFLNVGGRKGGIDFDELGIQDVVELLRGDETDLPAILRDFGNRTRGEDPVIHFYEHFLSAYNKKLKIQRGVFYTPQAVVSYIARSVHELLQTEFGLEDGLASTVTWGEMLDRYAIAGNPPQPPFGKGGSNHDVQSPPLQKGGEGGFCIPEGTAPNSPFVVILDPATGTATFLVEVIDIIYKTLAVKWRKQGMTDKQREAAWNEYVPKHLLPRLYGYELMMAPYAIAHMKIGLKLHETGYRFGSEERARIYLTNALEPATDDEKQMEIEEWAPALAHEAQAVNAVKQGQRFTVVIGNPPYSGHSVNNGEWIAGLLRKKIIQSAGYFEMDGAPLGEKNPKWLNDDYVKFIRLAQVIIEQASTGVLGFITNHGYLDNPTFRGMRQSLTQTFDRCYLFDLHGNSKKKEKAEDGGKDENVFDIQQGVACGLFVKTEGRNKPPDGVSGNGQGLSPETVAGRPYSGLHHADLLGLRAHKYQSLKHQSLTTTAWEYLQPQRPFYLFVQQDRTLHEEYDSSWKITEFMPINGWGIATRKDYLLVNFERIALVDMFEKIRTISCEEAISKYGIKESPHWSFSEAAKQLSPNIESHVHEILFRPFDIRHVYYEKCMIERGDHRFDLMSNMIRPNLSLITVRRMEEAGEFRHFFCTNHISVLHSTSAKEGNFVFPLYIYPATHKTDLFDDAYLPDTHGGHRSNFATGFISTISLTLNLTYLPDGKGDLKINFGPEDVFDYIYALFYSPTYRTRYAEFLKIDFPRIPLPNSLALFQALSKLGGELVSLHLVESPKLIHYITEYQGEGDNYLPKKPVYKDGAVWVNASQRFENVPEAVWNFHIGGYQVCEKWLKDRKGRYLSAEDIAHYQKIVVALNETMRLMGEIDAVIDQHGGWPGAFQP
jgi:hypothetical protein